MLSTILSLLLFVLKLIGFLILFILAIILVVFFVPLRYGFAADAYREKPIHGNVQISWFFHLIHVQVDYLSKTFIYDLKILGKMIYSNRPEFLEKKKEKAAQKRKKAKGKTEKKESSKSRKEDSSEVPKEEIREEVLVPDISSEENTLEDNKSKENTTVASQEKKEAVPYNPTRQPTVFPEENPKKKEQKEKQVKKESKKDSKTEKKKKKKAKKDSDSKEEKKSLFIRIEEAKALMDEYQVVKLLGIAKMTLIRILKHVLPGKMEGYVHYGFDDPGLTGKVTGYAAIFYPLYHKTLTIQPDFQEKCIEGDLKGSGRIRLAFFIWILITLLLKKEVRKLIRFVLK